MKKTPFGKIKKKLFPVFPHTEYGDVFLVSTGFPDPNIYPEEVQEAERSAGTVQYLLNTAAIRLSEKVGCKPIEAKKLFAPQIRQHKYEDCLKEDELRILRSLLNKATEELAEKEKIGKDEARSRLGDPLAQDTEIVYDYTMYLDETELNKLFESMPTNTDREKEIRAAVTLTMRHRVAKCVKVVGENNTVDCWFDLAPNDRLKYKNQILVVDNYNTDTGIVTFKGFGVLPIGADLFLLKSEASNEFAHGMEDWEDEDTLALKAIWAGDRTAFDAVYEFFQAEISGGSRAPKQETVDAKSEDLGELNGHSPTTSSPPQLIGANSTIE
jgi:hypothetical protein